LPSSIDVGTELELGLCNSEISLRKFLIYVSSTLTHEQRMKRNLNSEMDTASLSSTLVLGVLVRLGFGSLLPVGMVGGSPPTRLLLFQTLLPG
jgi:F0F1-type ATP synthase assembly protein I